ncbi:MAG: glycoside hydrolase N-terminal domain-containing protein, partial [Micromonosporaceae bacterium]|nr:glycoside hydrolase N-terminal domain-containing protein [Micromonosporaceae bacterium]
MSDHVNASDAGFTHGVRSTTVARSWEEALVTGNGTQGALCFGDAAALRITLSHERLFLPVTAPLPAPETARILPELRALLETGHGALAARRVCELAEAEHPGFAATRWIDPLVGAATLAFDSGRTMVSHDRMVDFRSGLVTLRGGDPAGGLIHQIFVSRPANLVVLCCRATPPEPSAQGGSPAGPLDGVFRLVPIAGKPPVPIAVLSSIEPDRLVMTASFPDRWPGTISGYTVTCHVVAEGPEASLAPEGDGLRCRGAREVLVLARVEV